VAEYVDLTQAHGFEKITDGRGVVRDTRTSRRWI
jgi:hypothetical protein